ncbi:MAG: condensation domain-containing protein [Cyanobacteria bacterium J06639_16]
MPTKQELSQRISALSPNQRAALLQQLQQLGIERQVPSGQSAQRLVAYVVLHADVAEPNLPILRDALKAKLPHYMVPAAIVPLKKLPRTANGKVDTKALPAPQPAALSDRIAAPRNSTETTLTQIWRDVLRLEAIGIHDNFFELGGDSILSIQIVSRAREVGLRLAPSQLFEQPTIAELAAVVNLAPEVAATQTIVTGSVPLTPIQHWFFEQAMVAPHQWHQAMMFEVPPGVSGEVVERAIATLWHHHDALRLCFSQDSAGWQQVNADASEPPSIQQIDLAHLSDADQRAAVAQHGSHLHASINLASGGLMRMAHFIRGANQPSWLLLSLHHLGVDTVSWQILQSDLATLLTQPNPSLPAKTTAFKTWAEMLIAQAAGRRSEASFWFERVESPAIALPRDYPNAPPAIEGTAQTITISLDSADTHALLQAVPAVYNTQINDVLLTALTQTLLQWVDARSGSVRIEVEAHGREAIAAGVDVSRTVGWFTTTYPVTLTLTDGNDCGTALKSVKEQLRQIPNRGIGYGMLRYLGDDLTRRRLAQAPPSEVLFNYLGQHSSIQPNSAGAGGGIQAIHDIDMGQLRDPRNRRSYLLEVNAWVADGRLQHNWRYDTQIYAPDTLTAIANRYLTTLKAIIAHCTTTDSGGFTPSDFPDTDFSQSELDAFIGQLTQEA